MRTASFQVFIGETSILYYPFIEFYSYIYLCVLLYHKQQKFTAQQKTVMSYNIVLHVSVHTNHHQPLLIRKKFNKHKYISACNCNFMLTFNYVFEMIAIKSGWWWFVWTETCSEVFFIVVPCILITWNSSLPTNVPFIKHKKMLKFTLKCPTFAATCFGPPGASSGSLYWAWLKLHFCRRNQ